MGRVRSQTSDHTLVRSPGMYRHSELNGRPSCRHHLPPPPANQTDTLKHHGQSGGGQVGEVRHPMALQLILSDLFRSREDEGDEPVYPTGEEMLTRPRKHRRRYVSSQCHHLARRTLGL